MKKSEKIAAFKKQWDELNLIKIFEPQVIDKRTNEIEYIIFDISIQKHTFVAKHIALTSKQERSKKIAYTAVVIDFDYSLDANLQNLYDACTTAITDSEFYTLAD